MVSIAASASSRSRPKSKTPSKPVADRGPGLRPPRSAIRRKAHHLTAAHFFMQSIAIDVMSGDRTPRDYVAGVVHALNEDSAFQALLVGDPATIEGALNGASASGARKRIEIVPAAEVVAMDESPRRSEE